MPFVVPENPGPVRAKFYVSELHWREWGVEIEMRAVTRGEDNKMWAQATPNGTVKMSVKNQVASDQFAPGQEWYLDFTPVPVDQVGEEGM